MSGLYGRRDSREGDLVAEQEQRVERLIATLDRAWSEFVEATSGLDHAALEAPGAAGEWAIRDLLAHVAIWENEAMEHVPVVLADGRPPRYASVGGIDAFNAREVATWRPLSTAEVRARSGDAHQQLMAFVEANAAAIVASPRTRKRLRLDTYGHYPEHTAAIREWRKRSGA
jgi:hypothetical protein